MTKLGNETRELTVEELDAVRGATTLLGLGGDMRGYIAEGIKAGVKKFLDEQNGPTKFS